MYPAQTSFIPVQIALARFLELNGLKAIFKNYPYWYLGTTPFRFLTGPVLPLSLTTLHHYLPNFNLFEIFYLLIVVCWMLGGFGVYLLVKNLENHSGRKPSRQAALGVLKREKAAILSSFFYLFGPIVPFIFRFSDGAYLIAFSFLPYTLFLYIKVLKRWDGSLPNSSTPGESLRNTPGVLSSLKNWQPSPRRSPAQTARPPSEMLSFSPHPRGVRSGHPWGGLVSRHVLTLIFLLTFVILLDSLILPTLILGMAAIFLAYVGWKNVEERLKQSFLVFTFALLLTTFWYTPRFWLTILGAPSFGGKSLVSIIVWLGKLLPVSLALAVAIFSVKFFKKKNLLRDFCFYWLFIFGFLSLLRFLSDPDFWIDWIAYGAELQMGGGIGMGLIINQILKIKHLTFAKAMQRQEVAANKQGLKVRTSAFLAIFFTFYLLLFTFIFKRYILETWQKEIAKTVEYRIGKVLSEVVKPGEKVFLSGSTAFWLNAFFDIPQVRGGVDQVATHPTWDKATWEIREGKDAQRSARWLKKLKIDYLVVHTKISAEFYHDFKYPGKFEGVEGLKKIYEKEGDRIYVVED